MATRVNFFICGAPRAGTTSLYQWLSQHPDIFLPQMKEPQFYAPELKVKCHRTMRLDDADDYAALFSDAPPGQLTGEGSTWYFLSPEAPRRLHEAHPDAKLIFVLRHPAELVFSWHGMLLENDFENLPFEQALDAEQSRRRGEKLPSAYAPLEGLFYSEVGRYATVLKRFQQCYPASQMLIEFHEDLVARPADFYRRVLEFLDVDDTFQADFTARNARTSPRSSVFRHWLNQPPAWIRLPLHALTTEPMRAQLHKRLCDFNNRQAPPPSLPPHLRTRLMAMWESELTELEKMLSRPLPDWQ